MNVNELNEFSAPSQDVNRTSIDKAGTAKFGKRILNSVDVGNPALYFEVTPFDKESLKEIANRKNQSCFLYDSNYGKVCRIFEYNPDSKMFNIGKNTFYSSLIHKTEVNDCFIELSPKIFELKQVHRFYPTKDDFIFCRELSDSVVTKIEGFQWRGGDWRYNPWFVIANGKQIKGDFISHIIKDPLNILQS